MMHALTNALRDKVSDDLVNEARVWHKSIGKEYLRSKNLLELHCIVRVL